MPKEDAEEVLQRVLQNAAKIAFNVSVRAIGKAPSTSEMMPVHLEPLLRCFNYLNNMWNMIRLPKLTTRALIFQQ